MHFCASKIQTADELLLLAVKSCIKNQSEKLTITWNHSMQGSLGVIQTGSFKSGFRLRCRWFLLFTSGENSGKIFPLSFPFKKLLKCWVAHLHFDLCRYYRYLEVLEKNNGHGGNIADHYQGDYWNYFLYTHIFSIFFMRHAYHWSYSTFCSWMSKRYLLRIIT